MYDAGYGPVLHMMPRGVCSACRHYGNRKNVDWDARCQEFEAYCDKCRGMNGPGGYDCAVAVSGGKDSHFQVWMLKEVMHMNPILFSVEDNFPHDRGGPAQPEKHQRVIRLYHHLLQAQHQGAERSDAQIL